MLPAPDIGPAKTASVAQPVEKKKPEATKKPPVVEKKEVKTKIESTSDPTGELNKLFAELQVSEKSRRARLREKCDLAKAKSDKTPLPASSPPSPLASPRKAAK
mgnify:CR=1 FL=1